MAASVIFLLLVLPGAFAGSVDWLSESSSCASRCPEASKFTYQTGRTYEYRYVAETRTTMAGATDNVATIHIDATVLIEVLDSCEMALRLTDVKVTRSHEDDPDRMVEAASSPARRSLEKRPLRFAFYDGAIGEVCPDEQDDGWALNIKRGVLTAFQNSMQVLDRDEQIEEVDVTGRCLTMYKVTQKGYESLTVTKVKDILSCQDRQSARTSILSTPFTSPNAIQSLPLMKTTYECRHSISSEGRLVTSSCQEVHVFRPFSKGANGAVTEASQKLTYQRHTTGVATRKGPVSKKTTLLFEHKHGLTVPESRTEGIKAKLEEICSATADDIRPEVPGLYGELVYLIRDFSYSDLKDVDRQLQQKKVCVGGSERARKFFLNALPATGTAASVSLMSDILRTDEIKEEQEALWLTSLAFLPNPSLEVVTAAQAFISDTKVRAKALLPVSALVNNYCEHNPGCPDEPSVVQLMASLTRTLGSDCRVSYDKIKELLLTLRAIGNIGRSETVALHLEPCFIKSGLPMDIRVAAMEAYRRLPCTADRNNVLQMFLRVTEDAELRIAAYLAAMQCPTEGVVQQVRDALLSEEVNQVGSFVWTHLTNLLETSSPAKQAIRDLLENEILQREFSMDRRKYSRNYEVSFFNEKFNLGGVYESNIIWSSSSFVPRSAMMNLTVDLFGQSVNLLEVGGRVQGLQYLLDSYLGPRSRDAGTEGGYGVSSEVKEEKLANVKSTYGGDVKEDLRAQLYLRVFGNELVYSTLDSSDLERVRGRKGKPYFEELLQRLAKNEQFSFSHNAMFLDSTLLIPTTVGLPLNLTLNGSASVEVKASGKVDVAKINDKQRAFEISANLQPSGAVEVVATMSVDAFLTKVGLRTTSRLHTSTAFQGRMDLARGQVFSLTFDFPRDQLEILDFQSKFFIIHDSSVKEQLLLAENPRTARSCTGESFSELTGIEMCAAVSFPNGAQVPDAPYCPFTGPISVSITLKKHDLPSGYRLLAKQVQTNSSSMAQVLLETPTAKMDRATSLSYSLSFKEKTLEAELLSPWKKANLKLALEETKEMMKALGEVTLTGEQKYSAVLQLIKELREKKNESSAKLSPTLTVTSPEGTLLFFTANVDYKQNKHLKAGLELEIKDVLRKPITTDFSISMRDRKGKIRYKVDFKMMSQFITVKSSSHISTDIGPTRKKGALVTARTQVDYTVHALSVMPRDQLKLGLKVHDRSTASLQKYSFTMNMDSKSFPEASLLVTGEGSYKGSLSKVDVKLRHGKNVKLLKDQTKEMAITASVNHKIKDSEAQVAFSMQASYPEKDIDYHLNGKHEHNKQTAEQYLTVRYGKGHSVNYHSRLTQTQKQRNVTVDLSYPGRDVKLNADLSLKDEASKHYVLSGLAQLQKGEKNSLVVSFKRPTDSSIEMVSDINLHNLGTGKLDLAGNYALRGMRGRGSVVWEKRNYSVEYTSDIQRGRYGKWTVDVTYPGRRITGKLEGGSDRVKAVKRTMAEVQWDADADPTQKVGVAVEIADTLQPGEVNIGGMVEMFTPLEGYQHFKAQLQFENSTRRIACIAEVVPGSDNDQFSVKFDLPLPITKNSFGLTTWLKTPFNPVKILALEALHNFDEAGKLVESLRGDFNQHFLEVKLSGASKGDLVQRKFEGSASLASSIPQVNTYKLSFNHYDNGIRYLTQTRMDANGDQYFINMEASFTKVHVQISTDGSVTIRVPQREWPVTLTWKHKNSLHELNTTLSTTVSPSQTVKLGVGGLFNAVTKTAECDVALSGPWGENETDHVTELHFRREEGKEMMKISASLLLNKDQYSFSDENEWSKTAFTRRSSLSMTNPQVQVQTYMNVKYGKFPMSATAHAQINGDKVLDVKGEVRKEKEDTFNSQLNFALTLDDDDSHLVAVRANHDKQGSLWVTDGSATYNKRKTVSFRTRMDLENFSTMWLSVDSPFEEAKKIEVDYTHMGEIERQFTGRYNLKVLPHFDTITTEIVLSSGDVISSKLRVDTPFNEVRYIEVNCHTFVDDGRRHSTVELDYHPKQVYKLDTAYVLDFPKNVDVAFNLTTPLPELPSLVTEVGFKYTDSDVTGKVRVIGPNTNFEEFATSFGHRRDGNSLSTSIDATVPSLRKMNGKADLSWENEIDGTISFDSTGQGQEPMQFILSHRGYTWEDFRTKAGFRMNGDRLESEIAYSNKDGNKGLFMLATPDPDIDYLKATFLHRLSEDDYEGRWTVQYGESAKPYEAGIKSTYSNDKLAFGVDLKTPHTKDFVIDLGFSGGKKIETKLSCVYGMDKVETLMKYKILENSWDVGGEFEYRIQGEGRDIGLTFTREGPLNDLNLLSTGKYMGSKVQVDAHYKDVGKKIGEVSLRTTFEKFKNLGASFEHRGDADQFVTQGTLRYMDGQEAEGSLDFQRRDWKRVNITAILKLPIEDYEENKLTYEHTRRKSGLSAQTVLSLGKGNTITGEVLFQGDSKLTMTVKGPFKDFSTFEAKGLLDEQTKSFDGEATLTLISQKKPLTASYLVKADNWPVMINVKAQTPFQDWENTELTVTHDGDHKAFTTMSTLKALAVGTVTSEASWTFNSESSFEGTWSLTSGVSGAENLKLAVKNSKVRGEYQSQVEVGWELLKAVRLQGSFSMGDEPSDNTYEGSVSMTTPFDSLPQVGFSLTHAHDDSRIKDTTVATYDNRRYFDADFEYLVGDRREGRLEVREPRPMEFLVGGRYKLNDMEGDLKLNWDKTSPEMNIHLSGKYKDQTDELGTDKELKLVAIHPARTMGVEYVLKKAEKEFQTYMTVTWDREADGTLAYDLRYNDRSSRYTWSYDALVKVAVPMRSVQVEGAYSDTGRVKNTRTAILWDADRDKNMKVGMNGAYDVRGETRKVQMGLELPFIDKEYSLTTETTVNSGNTLVDTRTEFSYSNDPRQLLVLTTRFDDVSFGRDATTNYSLSLGLIHPMTNVDIHMTSHVGYTDHLGSMATKVLYVTADRQKKNLELRGQIDKLRKNMVLELKSPFKNVALEGNLIESGNYNLSLRTREDGLQGQVTSVVINPESKTMDLTFHYDKDAPQQAVKVSGYLINGNMLQTEVTRLSGGQRVSETLVTVRLNSSHVLHTRVNWRPSMLVDLQQYISTQLTVFSYASSEAFKAAAQAVGQEVEAKYQAIMEEVREETKPVVEHLQREIGSVKSQLDIMQRDMRRFYVTNALHVRDFGEIANETFTLFYEAVRSLSVEYQLIYNDAQQEILAAMQSLGRYPMAEKYAELVGDFAAGLLNTRALLEGALGELSRQVAELSDATYRQYILVSRQIERKLQGYTAALQQATQFNGFGKLFTSYPMLGSYDNYRQLAEAANEKMLAALDKLGLKDTYLNLVNKSRQLLVDQFSDIVQRPEYQQIYVIGNEIYQQGVWAYQYWQVENNAHMALGQMLQLLKDVTLLEITRVKNAIVDLDKSRVIVYDPQHGELQFEVYLPVPLKSLVEPPDVRLTKYINRIKSWVTTYIPTRRHSLWTSINSYVPFMDTATWLPPYKAYGYVMGDQHLVTFDQTHYNFAGRCSYILSRDMVDDRFTVVVNFNNRPRQPQIQSIIVLLRGVALEVNTDSKVKINEQERDLPFFSGSVSAVRQQNVVRVQDGDDLVVEMDAPRGIYSIGISGWYHGRTAGLLGTYDNERFNDLTDASRKVSDAVEEFANSWEVSPNFCRTRNTAGNDVLDESLPEVQACTAYLNSSSSYYTPCFAQLSSEQSVRACVEYVRSGVSQQRAQCRAGEQYRYMCRRKGVVIGTPAECVTCAFPDGREVVAASSEEVRSEEGQRSADVVFVVEESACNEWARSGLPRMAATLETALLGQGLQKNRFGLISYYGNGSREDPFVHTVQGQIFGDSSNFLKAAETLRLASSSSSGNPAGALRSAMMYPYRVGVAKVLVLVPCAACGGDLRDLASVLQSHGFVLHVLQKEALMVTESNNHSPVKVYGADRYVVLTRRATSRSLSSLAQHVQLPQDECVVMALATNGSVFDVTHMRERERIQREFLEAFASRAAHSAGPPPCQVCSCHDDGAGGGHAICRLCEDKTGDENHIPFWLQSSTTSVMSVINDLHHRVMTALLVPPLNSTTAA